jgi:CMP-N-acetylneuraminic acid synthetase
MVEQITDTIAFIPARAGSKGVPNKNIRLLRGFPLLAYSVVAAARAEEISSVVLSTDSPDIAGIGKRFGAEIPYLRPSELAQDKSLDIEVIRYHIDWLIGQDKHVPRYIAYIRPTTPIRDPAVIDSAIRKIRDHTQATSLRSVHELPEPPQKMMGFEGEYLTGLFPQDTRKEYYNLPRQSFPPAYHPNGYIDIFDTDHLLTTGTLFGDRVLGFVTEKCTEIDAPDDFDYADYYLSRYGAHNNLFQYLSDHFS